MRCSLFLLGFCFATLATAGFGYATDSNRVLVISAATAEDPSYRAQAALLLPAWRGLLERDFLVETRFGVAKFSVVLIGKDGGEKLRRDTPLKPDELFAIVDAMPMRRAEIRERAPAPR